MSFDVTCKTYLSEGQRKRKHGEVASQAVDGKGINYAHRLHYHWSQLERDRAFKGNNIGSPLRPRKVDRIVKLSGAYTPPSLGASLRRKAKYNLCAQKYKTIDYHTFAKNGVLKLTEIELYFLNSIMTRKTSCNFAVVYLGLGGGDRFRFLRDDFFPELMVLAFDPLDTAFRACKPNIEETARKWTADGTHFKFLLRCFDPDTDMEWIKEEVGGRRLLFISDIRGIHRCYDGSFDKDLDQEIQWKAIQALQPELSMVKFAMPSAAKHSKYPYAPGVLLRQVFTNYQTGELRLLITGVPDHVQYYDTWEVTQKSEEHHLHLRGQVYRSTRRSDQVKCACLDHCFDCTVLWETISSYAEKNSMNPYDILSTLILYHIYSPPDKTWDPSWSEWDDFIFYLQEGRLKEALGALDSVHQDDFRQERVRKLSDEVSETQPELGARLRSALGAGDASLVDLVRIIGSLSNPFTFVRNHDNGTLEVPRCWYFDNGCCTAAELCKYKHVTDAEQGGSAPTKEVQN